MNESSYVNYCEKLWNNWVVDTEIIKNELKQLLTSSFYSILQLDHCPEPYLVFNQQTDRRKQQPLIFLTTNPGGGMSIQTKENLEDSIKASLQRDYFTTAKQLANYYQNNLTGNALYRINGMYQLANLLGYDGFIQVELLPFHSNNLNQKFKNEIIDLYYKGDNPIHEYIDKLNQFLKKHDVIAIAASNNHENINEMNNWLQFISNNILGIKKPNFCKLGNSVSGKVSKSFTFDYINGCIKGLCLLSGTNNLPNKESLNEISTIIKDCKQEYTDRS